MSLKTLGARDRRAIRLGLIVIVGALALVRGLPSLHAWTSERQASAAELRHELQGLRSALGSQRERKTVLAERSVSLAALEVALLPGETPATAAASLARIIATAAESSGVDVRSAQLRTDSARAGATYSNVSVRIEAVGDARGLTNLLARLERRPPLLVVRALAVTQPEPFSEMEALRTELEIAGLARGRPKCDCEGPSCRCADTGTKNP